MASALQCPACGYKHRLTALAGDPIFPCAQCGRLLKTPAEFRRPEPSGPAEAPRPSTQARPQRGGAATADRTSVLPGAAMAAGPAAAGASAAGSAASVAPSAAALTTSGKKKPVQSAARRAASSPDVASLPVRLLAWVFAFVIGALIVRFVAKLVGFVDGDTLVNVMTGSGLGRYLKVFALVPIWALVATGLATLFIDGTRAWMRRRQLPKPKPNPQSQSQARPPKRPTRRPPTAPPGPTANPANAASNGGETRSPSSAAGTQRARRIPRRDVTS